MSLSKAAARHVELMRGIADRCDQMYRESVLSRPRQRRGLPPEPDTGVTLDFVDCLIQIADRFGYEPRWLLTGRGPARRDDPAQETTP